MRDLIGQRRLLSRLGARALRGDVAHAYGLFGPRSIGKRTAALRLAQTLNCPEGVPGGCGTCLSCRKIEHGSHPDVRTVTREAALKDISIEQVREMAEDLALRPLEGRRRVVIVDDASELNPTGQDALLKTLEEPPPHAVLLLLTRTPFALHQTILSRIQPLPFRLVPVPEIEEALAARRLPEPERHAAASGGRPGLAITLATDDAPRRERRALEDELFRLVSSGLTDRFAWAADLADDDDPRRRAQSLAARFDHWSELLRDASVAARGRLERPLRPERAAQTAAVAAAVPARDLLDATLLLDRLRRDMTFNANPRAQLELLALRLPYAAGTRGAAA